MNVCDICSTCFSHVTKGVLHYGISTRSKLMFRGSTVTTFPPFTQIKPLRIPFLSSFIPLQEIQEELAAHEGVLDSVKLLSYKLQGEEGSSCHVNPAAIHSRLESASRRWDHLQKLAQERLVLLLTRRRIYPVADPGEFLGFRYRFFFFFFFRACAYAA